MRKKKNMYRYLQALPVIRLAQMARATYTQPMHSAERRDMFSSLATDM